MARLQILELPEGADDDRPPFVLVIDEYVPQRYITAGGSEFKAHDPFEGVAKKIGARGVLIFDEPIEIPANETSAGAGGYSVKAQVEGGSSRALARVRGLHSPVDHQGQTICSECSAYDLASRTTDSRPVAYDQCRTLQVLNGPPA
jgi:hypothetical protein